MNLTAGLKKIFSIFHSVSKVFSHLFFCRGLSFLLILFSCSFSTGLGDFILKKAPSISGAEFTNDRMPEWRWAKQSGALKHRFRINSGEWVETDKLFYRSNVNLPEGSYNFELQAFYENKWSESSLFTTVIDVTPPSIYQKTSLFTESSSLRLEPVAYDRLSGIKTSEWTIIYGEEKSVLSDRNSILTDFKMESPGDYRLRFTVTDKADNMSISDIIVSYYPMNILYVSDSYSLSDQDGSISKPFNTLTDALLSASESSAKGFVIKVSQGLYIENIVIEKSNIRLDGGYSYDFTRRDRELYVTEIEGKVLNKPTITVNNSYNVYITGININSNKLSSHTVETLRLKNSKGEISSCLINAGNGIYSAAVGIFSESSFNIYNNIIRSGSSGRKSVNIVIDECDSGSSFFINNTLIMGLSEVSIGIDNKSGGEVLFYNNAVSALEGDYSLSGLIGVNGEVTAGNNLFGFKFIQNSTYRKNYNFYYEFSLSEDGRLPESIPLFYKKIGRDPDSIIPNLLNDDFIWAERKKGTEYCVGAFEYDKSGISHFILDEITEDESYDYLLSDNITQSDIDSDRAINVFLRNGRIVSYFNYGGNSVELDFPIKNKGDYRFLKVVNDGFGNVYFGAYDRSKNKYITCVFKGWEWKEIKNDFYYLNNNSIRKFYDFAVSGRSFYYIVSDNKKTFLYKYDSVNQTWNDAGSIDAEGDVYLSIYNDIPFFTLNALNSSTNVYYYNEESILHAGVLPSAQKAVILEGTDYPEAVVIYNENISKYILNNL